MADDSFYVRSHKDFLEMGLEGAARQVLREGLAAFPESEALRGLASAGAEQREPPRPLERPCAPPGGDAELDISSQDFWRELRASPDLSSLLRRRGGCVRVLDVFPADVAERAARSLGELEEGHWTASSTGTYKSEDSARHSFFRYDGGAVDEVKKSLALLDPALFPSFQAGKYVGECLLEAHDDSHLFQVDMRDANRSERYPAGKTLFRKVALIYYLSRDWRPEYGGSLLDLHGEARKSGGRRCLVPHFNSLVAFLVPRAHEVQQLRPGAPPRLSVFGWLSDDRPYPRLSQFGPEVSCMEQFSLQ